MMNTIANLLSTDDILVDVDASGKTRLLEGIGRHMENRHAMPSAWVTESLLRREQAGSTGLGEGVAIPHARIKDLDHIVVAYVRPRSLIAFDAPDGKPVSDILVLLVPKQATEEHLVILAEATQMFSDRQFRQRLHQCRTSAEIKALFDRYPPPA